jgi:hypothetical protein
MSKMLASDPRDWPALPLDEWRDTYETLHRWTQIVGKVRLERMPWINHSWHTTLYVTARGLTTSPIWCLAKSFQIDFDFVDHQLLILTGDGESKAIALRPMSVADFYSKVMTALRGLGVETIIDSQPSELADTLPFHEDVVHASYDGEAARRWWRALLQCTRVFTKFRAHFIGKCSPVHFFWGAFDLAVTRFSGRPAPMHPGGVPHLPDFVVREAYSHEVSSAGFWPGGAAISYPAFYSYAYPEPAGYKDAAVQPSGASYNPELREFILPYDAVRTAESPDEVLMEFLNSTYRAAADLGGWDRSALERESDPRGPRGEPF